VFVQRARGVIDGRSCNTEQRQIVSTTVDSSASEAAAIEALLHQAIKIMMWMGVVVVITVSLQAVKKAVVDSSKKRMTCWPRMSNHK
jgi:hypothetical protein